MKVYIGDPCYVMDDKYYGGVWGAKYEYKDGEFVIEGVPFAVCGTGGDGMYSGIHSRYPVDAGVLGIVPEKLWSATPETDLGYVVDVDCLDSIGIGKEQDEIVMFVNTNCVERIDTSYEDGDEDW